jgi:hypothetical protein
MPNCDCNGPEAWKAWHDRMPGKTPTLYVRGTCECPTPGYELTLRRQEPQGVDPMDLLLELVEQAPSGVVPEVLTKTAADYSEPTDMEYQTVSIMPDGPMGIKVKPVS